MQKRNHPISPPNPASFFHRVKPWCCAAIMGAVLATVPRTHAAELPTANFTVPFFRGLSDTEWAGWDNFTDPVGTPGNAPDVAGSTGNGVITQSDPTAFLTGGANIYSFAAPTSFNVADNTPYTLGSVVFQARTLGTEMDYSSVLLQYDNGGGAQTLAATRIELDRALAGAGGSAVSSMWEWDVSSLNIDDFNIVFGASGSSMSFAAATLDTASFQVVPEPSTYALMVMGGLALFATQHYRRKMA
jgi:hypothetical protein